MTLRNTFINKEIWILTFSGAFQRAGVYRKSVAENNRMMFRNFMRKEIDEIVANNYHLSVKEADHIRNIQQIVKLSEKYSNILSNRRLTFGVSQKLLNLYLKYLWCLGRIPEPPHCPFDRLIIKGLGIKPIPSWTKIDNINVYMMLVSKARSAAGASSLPVWELKRFSRRT